MKMHNPMVFCGFRTINDILDQCKGGKKTKGMKIESCRDTVSSCSGMLSLHTKTREQHVATCFPCAAAWRPFTKFVFLTHVAACQIMPWHDLKNLKIKNPRTFSLFYTSQTFSPKLKTLTFPNLQPSQPYRFNINIHLNSFTSYLTNTYSST